MEEKRELVLMPRPLVEQVINYLGNKPFGEVAPIINSIQANSHVIPEEILIEKDIIKLRNDVNDNEA